MCMVAMSKVDLESFYNIGPTGANLFVYHLPISMTEEDLFTLFCKYGLVLSTKVWIWRE